MTLYQVGLPRVHSSYFSTATDRSAMQGLVRCPQARIHTCRASAVPSHTARPSLPAGLGACQARRVVSVGEQEPVT